MEQDAVCLDAGKRDKRRNGDFKAEDLDQLVDRLRQDLVRAEGEPEEGREEAGGAQPARREQQESLNVVASDVGGPVERRGGPGGEHGGGRSAVWAGAGLLWLFE